MSLRIGMLLLSILVVISAIGTNASVFSTKLPSRVVYSPSAEANSGSTM